MVDLISRLIMLPILIVMVGVALILPFFPLLLVTQPSPQTLWVVLFALGAYPFILSYLHGAIFIEHFITRSISKKFADENNMLPDVQYLNLSWKVGAYLSKALCEFGPTLDEETRRRGRLLLQRHQAINRFVWPGMGVSTIAGIGIFVLEEFGLP